jgi:hypothetical protein
MKTLKISIFFILVIFFSSTSFSFVQSKLVSGVFLRLNNNGSDIIFDYYLDDLNIDDSVVDSYFIELSSRLSSGLGQAVLFNKGDSGSDLSIRCSGDLSLFSSSTVAAVTQISYDDDGQILAANIILNLNIDISSDELQYNYFGNTISHEVGHSLGLDHSTSWASTMTPHLSPGQHTWELDDYTGAAYALGLSQAFSGEITGVIVGGDAFKSIFGAVVDLVDLTNMKSVQSQITGRDGSFTFINVDKSKKYMIFYGPFDYSSYYQTDYLASYNSFCQGGSSYQYTVLSSCFNSYNDAPRILSFGNDDYLDIGQIGIKCDVESSDVLFNYTINDESEDNLLEKVPFDSKSIYLKSIVADERNIKIPIILENISSDEVLRISIYSQLLKSPILLSGKITHNESAAEYILGSKSNISLDDTDFPSFEGLPNYNYEQYINLSSGTNNLEVELSSFYLSNLLNGSLGSSFSEKNFYFSPGSDLGTFILGVSVGKIDEMGVFMAPSDSGTSISNDYFSCSSAINSFEIPGPAVSESSTGGKALEAGGCSAIASSGEKAPYGHFYFLMEFLFYIISYGAFRRLTNSLIIHK